MCIQKPVFVLQVSFYHQTAHLEALTNAPCERHQSLRPCWHIAQFTANLVHTESHCRGWCGGSGNSFTLATGKGNTTGLSAQGFETTASCSPAVDKPCHTQHPARHQRKFQSRHCLLTASVLPVDGCKARAATGSQTQLSQPHASCKHSHPLLTLDVVLPAGRRILSHSQPLVTFHAMCAASHPP